MCSEGMMKSVATGCVISDKSSAVLAGNELRWRMESKLLHLQVSSGLASGKAGETLQGNTGVGNSGRSCRQVERSPQVPGARLLTQGRIGWQ